MARTSFLSYAQIAYFSGPASERVLYRRIAQIKPQRILEIGLGLGVRSMRMLRVAKRFRPTAPIHFTGIDLFEARPADSARMSLKAAYKLLRTSGTQVRLLPGQALSAMTQTANAAQNTDLIVIDSEIRDSDLRSAWRYFPRMIHPATLILRQELSGSGKRFRSISVDAIQKLAGAKHSPGKQAA